MRKIFLLDKKKLLKTILVVLIMVVAIISQTGCSNKEAISKSDFCLDTNCDITIYGVSQPDGEKILEGAYSEIRKYEDMFSKTRKNSEISRINDRGATGTKVSEDTVELIELGMYMGDISNGSFDVSIGAAMDLWDFKGEKENPSLPDEGALKGAISTVDYKKILIEDNMVYLQNPGMKLDLGGVAKGYIADKTTQFLESKGIEKGVINLGGNVVAIGEKEEGEAWNIGVERPYSDRSELLGSVKVKSSTLSTSGIYERMFKEGDKIYHHVLDPKSGYPIETEVEAVTIKTAKGYSAYADGLSTVCLALGMEDGLKLIEELQRGYPKMKLEAAFIDKDDKIVQTENMRIERIK